MTALPSTFDMILAVQREIQQTNPGPHRRDLCRYLRNLYKQQKKEQKEGKQK